MRARQTPSPTPQDDFARLREIILCNTPDTLIDQIEDINDRNLLTVWRDGYQLQVGFFPKPDDNNGPVEVASNDDTSKALDQLYGDVRKHGGCYLSVKHQGHGIIIKRRFDPPLPWAARVFPRKQPTLPEWTLTTTVSKEAELPIRRLAQKLDLTRPGKVVPLSGDTVFHIAEQLAVDFIRIDTRLLMTGSNTPTLSKTA